jgi:hypothetical protein
LHKACFHNFDLEVIRYIVEELKLGTNNVASAGHSCFTLACFNNSNLDIIKYLVHELKINTDHTTSFNDNGFTIACQMGNGVGIIKYLVEELKVNINCTNKNGFNGFALACYCDCEVEDMDPKNSCFDLNTIKYLNEHTNIKQSLKGVRHDVFKIILEHLVNTNNYARFMDLLDEGMQQYSKEFICDLVKPINPLMLTEVLVHMSGTQDPYTLRFNRFVKVFDVLPVSVKEHLCAM